MQEITYIWSSYSVCGDADADADAHAKNCDADADADTDADADDDMNVLFKATYELLFMPTFAV